MIETRHLKNVVIFIQAILSFVLSRKIIIIHISLNTSSYLDALISLFFIHCFVSRRWFNPVLIPWSTSHINLFLKLSIRERCMHCYLLQVFFQTTMFFDDTEELISQTVVVLIRVVFWKSQNLIPWDCLRNLIH